LTFDGVSIVLPRTRGQSHQAFDRFYIRGGIAHVGIAYYKMHIIICLRKALSLHPRCIILECTQWMDAVMNQPFPL
jgi:hypothetical protein